jgi:Zn-dependent metalloprotease
VNLGKTHAWDQAGPIWYDALCKRLSTRAQFADAKAATIAAATALYSSSEAQAVRAAWETVGV